MVTVAIQGEDDDSPGLKRGDSCSFDAVVTASCGQRGIYD